MSQILEIDHTNMIGKKQGQRKVRHLEERRKIRRNQPIIIQLFQQRSK